MIVHLLTINTPVKINGTKISLINQAFLSLFLSQAPQIIEKWKNSEFSSMPFDSFLLQLKEDASIKEKGKKVDSMTKAFVSRIHIVIGIWKSYNTDKSFDEWCISCNERHRAIVAQKKKKGK